MTRRRTLAVAVLVCGALASVATDRGETAVSSVEGREVMDTGVSDCWEPSTLCVAALDADGQIAELAWAELYDADGVLLLESDVGATEWCAEQLEPGDYVVVVELTEGGSLSSSAEVICGEPTLLTLEVQ